MSLSSEKVKKNPYSYYGITATAKTASGQTDRIKNAVWGTSEADAKKKFTDYIIERWGLKDIHIINITLLKTDKNPSNRKLTECRKVLAEAEREYQAPTITDYRDYHGSRNPKNPIEAKVNTERGKGSLVKFSESSKITYQIITKLLACQVPYSLSFVVNSRCGGFGFKMKESLI